MNDPRELIDRYFDGTLTEAEDAALQRWLDENSAHVAEFVRLAHVHSALYSMFVGERDAQLYGDSPAALRKTPRGRHFTRMVAIVKAIRRPTPLSMTVATVVMGLLLTSMYFMVPPFYRSLTQTQRGHAPQPGDIVAEVTAVHGVVWRTGSLAAPLGTLLTSGRILDIESGLVEVTFRQGAVVGLQGPCELSVDAPNAGSLTAGNLIAHVETASRGFRVTTPNAEIVDLGTKFGVAVEQHATRVVVFEGFVDVIGGRSIQRLGQGEGVRLVGVPQQVAWERQWDYQLATDLIAVGRALTYRIISTAQWGPTGTFRCSHIDLADRQSPTLASAKLVAGEAAFQSDASKLFDGEVYADQDSAISDETLTPRDGTVVEIAFDVASHTAGYDIRTIHSLTGTKQGRALQHYSVAAQTVGGEFEWLLTIDESLPNNVQRATTGEVKVVTYRDGAPLATNVAALRFTFHDVKSAPEPEMMYREIDVFGEPSPLLEAAPPR